MNLSPAATIVLTRAAERPDGRLEFHRKLPTAARHKMIDALLRQGLIVETQGDYRLCNGSLLIESTSTGLMLTTLALTDTGLRAIGRHTDETPAATEADTAPPAASDEAVAQEALAVADALDAATMAPTQRKPREGTKQEAVLAMLRREEGATTAQIAEATGWASHTIRGFLSIQKKKGVKIDILDRVRMVGPNREGAKGSFTVYRVAG